MHPIPLQKPTIAIGAFELPVYVRVDPDVEAEARAALPDDGIDYDDEYPDLRPVEPYIATIQGAATTFDVVASNQKQNLWMFGSMQSKPKDIEQARLAIPNFGIAEQDPERTEVERFVDRSWQIRAWFESTPHVEIRVPPGSQILATNAGQPIYIDGEASVRAIGCNFIATRSRGAGSDIQVRNTAMAIVDAVGISTVSTKNVTELQARLDDSDRMNAISQKSKLSFDTGRLLLNGIHAELSASSRSRAVADITVDRAAVSVRGHFESLKVRADHSEETPGRDNAVWSHGDIDDLAIDGHIKVLIFGSVERAFIDTADWLGLDDENRRPNDPAIKQRLSLFTHGQFDQTRCSIKSVHPDAEVAVVGPPTDHFVVSSKANSPAYLLQYGTDEAATALTQHQKEIAAIDARVIEAFQSNGLHRQPERRPDQKQIGDRLY